MENNRLIAEFMGLRTNSYGDYNIDKDVMGFDMIVCSLADTKFLTSWDWLMPVVEKIDRCWPWQDSYYRRQEVRSSLPDMDRTYDAVVEFIKEYNDAPYTGFNGK